MVGHNESEGIEPRNHRVAQGQGFHLLEARNAARGIGECVAMCRGRSPWQVIERCASEPGRPMPFPTEAPDKLKRRGRGMAAWESDQLIVEV